MNMKDKKKNDIPRPISKRQHMYVTSNCDVTLYGGAAGSGKALRHGSKVLTVSGWVNIEDIEVGDSVIGHQNNIEKVLAVYPQGQVDIYRVTFQDGASVDCCENHLWSVRKAGDGLNRKPVVINTLDLKKYVEKENNKTGRKRHAI